MFLRRSERFDPGTVTEGREVYSVEGEKLGTVSEISGSYLHVNAAWKRDYWLSAEYIDRTNGGVYMNFSRNQLDHYKLSEPGLEPEEDPMRDVSREAAVSSEEEQLEQRARMELELAQQRRQLPPEHAAGTVGMPVEEELAVIEQEIGLPLSDIKTGAASPTGAMVSGMAPDADRPAPAGGNLPATVRSRGLWVTVAFAALAAAALFLALRLRR